MARQEDRVLNAPQMRGRPFAPGNAGRPKGSGNKVPRLLQEAALGAAARHGSDGKGKGGLDGFFDWAARRHPVEFLRMVAKLLPKQVTIEPADEAPQEPRSLEDLRAEARRRGLPDRIFHPPPRPEDDAIDAEPLN